MGLKPCFIHTMRSLTCNCCCFCQQQHSWLAMAYHGLPPAPLLGSDAYNLKSAQQREAILKKKDENKSGESTYSFFFK